VTRPCSPRAWTEIVEPDGEYLAAFSRSWPQASATRAVDGMMVEFKR